MPYDQAQSEGDNLQRAIPQRQAFGLTGELTNNAKGYDRAMKLTIGVIHWHTKLASQGVSVELSGKALAQAREASVTDIDILSYIAANKGNVSTMDSAIDVYNYDASERDIAMLFELGSLETTVREINPYASNKKRGKEWEQSSSIYIGSPKSPKQITIYNKAAEVGQPNKDWVRIEMTWRGKHARAAHAAMMKFGIASVTQKAVKSMLNADIEWFQEVINGDPVVIEPVRRPETNTTDWLIDFTAPLLKRQLDLEAPERFLALFETYSAILVEASKKRGNKRLRSALKDLL